MLVFFYYIKVLFKDPISFLRVQKFRVEYKLTSQNSFSICSEHADFNFPCMFSLCMFRVKLLKIHTCDPIVVTFTRDTQATLYLDFTTFENFELRSKTTLMLWIFTQNLHQRVYFFAGCSRSFLVLRRELPFQFRASSRSYVPMSYR